MNLSSVQRKVPGSPPGISKSARVVQVGKGRVGRQAASTALLKPKLPGERTMACPSGQTGPAAWAQARVGNRCEEDPRTLADDLVDRVGQPFGAAAQFAGALRFGDGAGDSGRLVVLDHVVRAQTHRDEVLFDGGRCGTAQIIPAAWVASLFEPCAIAPFYGGLLWLNRDGSSFPGASTRSAFMVGAGGHLTWIEPAHDAVVVARWLDPDFTAGFAQRVASCAGGRRRMKAAARSGSNLQQRT